MTYTEKKSAATAGRIAADILVGATAGVTIGVMIELLFSWLTASTYVPGSPIFLSQFDNVHLAVVIERIIYALLGISCLRSRVIWQHKSRSILANTCLHYVVLGIPLCVAGYVLYWFPHNIYATGSFLAVVTAIYALIWVVNYRMVAWQIKQMNERIAHQ